MRYLIYLTLMLSTSLSAGSIHKWTDENGNVHYGDAPPITAKTEGVRVLSAPSNPGKALPRLSNPASGDDSSTSGSDPSASSSDGSVPEDQAKIACEQAREDLEIIGRSSRIKLKTADGGSRYLTTEEIDERRIQAEGDVENFCQ